MKKTLPYSRYLKEATKTKSTIDLGNIFDQKFNSIVQQTQHNLSNPELKTAELKQTQAKLRNIQMSPKAAAFLSNIMTSGIEDDVVSQEELMATAFVTGVEEIPTTPDNLPAVINTAISVFGSNYEPEWHQVRNLPGYMQSGIRAIGRQVFKPFTNTPIEQIQVIADMGGQGPNNKQDLNIVSAWLKKYAVRDQHAELTFHEGPLAGYDAEVQIYKALNYSFMLVEDFMGRYIYAWPSEKGARLNQESTDELARIKQLANLPK